MSEAAHAEAEGGGRNWRHIAGVAGWLVLAWAPMAVLWGLFLMIYLEAPTPEAFRSGVMAIGRAAFLSVFVWWLSGRYPWPSTLRPRFYLAHLVFGLGYSVLWLAAGQIGWVMEGGDWREVFVSPLLGWRLLMGLWLYGCIVGVSYIIRMRRNLEEREREVIRAEALATEARLEALRAQLNPHFLFNALHTVNALVRTDPAGAREAVARLGRLLRYSLDHPASSVVALSEEWRFVEDYLAMERLRLGDRLRARCELAPEVESVSVPTFCLQPLVENAVIHGIAPSPDGGRVEVEASRDDGYLKIEVFNDVTTEADAPGDEGHGHRLLRERLAGLYAGQASMAVERVEGGGFRATIRIPRTGEGGT